jgi:hypothetical protein
MVKFTWCLSHHGNGRFTSEPYRSAWFKENSTRWKCLDCGAIMEKTGVELNDDRDWQLIEEGVNDSK